MRFRQRATAQLIKKPVLMTFLFLVCLRGVGWALAPEVPLQMEGDRLTGHLSQVTLRTVLDQLQKQLGIVYEAPAGELDKIISIDLQQAPILPALAKILAPWDYAFTVNAGGHLQFLYVMPKAPPAETTSERSKPSSDDTSSNETADTAFSPLNPNNTEGGTGDSDSSQAYEREAVPILPQTSTSHVSSPEEFHGLSAPVASAPMTIQPVPEGTTMPMMPAGAGGGMQVTPAASTPNMPIIPATAYPPMDIQPVPGYLKEEMLRNIQQ